MIDRLEATLKRYNDIGDELSNPDIVSDIKKMTELSREQTRLKEIVEVYLRYKDVLKGIDEDKELVHDKELGDIMADGKIDAKDASFILVAYSNASTGMGDGLTEDQRAAGDVNSDRKIDAKDASAILAYYSLVSTSSGDVPALIDFARTKQQ